MSIIVKDGFNFYDRFEKEDIFSFSTDIDVDKSIKYIKTKKLKYISLSESLLEKVENLDFLEELDFIEEIYISKFDMDYSAIYKLKNLKSLTIICKNSKPNVDYSKFINLEYLSLDWYNKELDLSANSKLKSLFIWKFKPKNKSFSFINLPKSLEKIHITESNIQNFEGLNLPKLKSFEGHYCSQLNSLEGLENICENLETLTLDYCRKLVQYNELKNCLNLEKLILGDCGDIPNLNWIKPLKKLKHFSFYNTKLIDGNVNSCFGIDYVSFKNSRHYNHKIEEFRKD